MNAVSYISDQLSKRDKNGKTEDVEDKVAVQKREKIVRRRSKFTSYAWAVILFFPQWLIIKPTQLIWWIISLPLLLIEYGLKSRLQRKSTKRSTGTLAITKRFAIIDIDVGYKTYGSVSIPKETYTAVCSAC